MKFFKQMKIDKENIEKIDALENDILIDSMIHQFNRFKSINRDLVQFYSPIYVWQKWIRR